MHALVPSPITLLLARPSSPTPYTCLSNAFNPLHLPGEHLQHARISRAEKAQLPLSAHPALIRILLERDYFKNVLPYQHLPQYSHPLTI